MISVANVVERIVSNSDFIEFALEHNFLNLSEYALYIKKEVEENTYKNVTRGAIVIALSRLKKIHAHKNHVETPFVISELSMRSPLCEVIFEQTEENVNVLRKMYQLIAINEKSFLTVTQSSSEIMITMNQHLKDKILHLFNKSKPKIVLDNLVGISVHFSEKYINQPNIFYSLLKNLAWNNISITDLVSTYSEFIIIIAQKDVQRAFEAINETYNMKNKENKE